MDGAWVREFGAVLGYVTENTTSALRLSQLLTKAIRSAASPVVGAEIIVEVNDGQSLVIGTAAPSDPDHVLTIPLAGGRHPHARLRLWFRKGGATVDHTMAPTLFGQLQELFYAWWTPDTRSPKGDLPTWTEATKRRGQGALSRQRLSGGPFSVIFCDLDGFKQINNSIGQAGGDEVIAKMARLLEGVASSDAFVIHHGGDEFVIVLPEGDADDAIDLSRQIVVAASEYDFGVKHAVGISLGIASRSGYPKATFEELVNMADEIALKEMVKAKSDVKGAMRVAGHSPTPPQWKRALHPCTLALVLRCSLGALPPRPAFASVWLNALVKAGTRAAAANSTSAHEIGDEILKSLKAFKLVLSAEHVSSLPFGLDPVLTASLSGLDVAAAGARVMFEQCIAGKFPEETRHLVIRLRGREASLCLGDEALLSIDCEPTEDMDLDLGPPWRMRHANQDVERNQTKSSPFILMEIGRNHLHALPHLAAEHIVIDDRPGRGGGLPDFWELSLSRLVSRLQQLPNVEHIVLVGDLAGAHSTYRKLDSAAGWDLDYISYKTAVPKDVVTDARDRLRGHVRHFEKEEDALDSLVEAATVARDLLPTPRTIVEEAPIVLSRTLNHPSAALTARDGCRVRTAGEAFPLLLELLRNETVDDEFIPDQDGLELRELVDFKVVIREPTQQQVPWFFRSEREQLEEYFKKEFLDDTGRFGTKLREKDAEHRVLDHVRWALTRTDGAPFATRRAILIIPHQPDEQPEAVAPLGLVSVRLLPRRSGSEAIVNVSFTWRTVEALIGFPYSLYGSLRYAQHLCDKLSNFPGVPQVRLGYVSYVAHSLHFFMSEESRRIARRIVGESSL